MNLTVKPDERARATTPIVRHYTLDEARGMRLVPSAREPHAIGEAEGAASVAEIDAAEDLMARAARGEL